MTLDFGESPRIVLIGENGTGKSSILDCLAILLSRFLVRVRKGAGREFTKYDVRVGSGFTRAAIKVKVLGEDLEWTVGKRKSGGGKQTISNLSQIKEKASRIIERMEETSGFALPVAVYYSVNRAVLDIPLRIRKKHAFDQPAAYDTALSGARNNFRLFFEWFRNREDLENEERSVRRDLDYVDHQLEAARTAIAGMMGEGYSGLRVRRAPLRMVIRKEGLELRVNELSDGEKCLLALIGDLARRLAIANPLSSRPLEGSGVALIDEVELHLHPAWQRDVVRRLPEIFPNCQFFMTTHSPQALSQAHQEEIVLLLHSDEGIQASMPGGRSFGRDSNRILQEVMGVAERPPDVKEELERLFRYLAAGETERAEQLRSNLEDRLGEDEPMLVRADVFKKRREVLGK